MGKTQIMDVRVVKEVKKKGVYKSEASINYSGFSTGYRSPDICVVYRE